MVAFALLLVGIFVVSWLFFWLLLALWALMTGAPIPPVIDWGRDERR